MSKLSKSLISSSHKLSNKSLQQKILADGLMNQNESIISFKDKLEDIGMYPIKPTRIEIFQMNVGYMCNQVCKHCHVDAGPDRKEIMTREVFNQCLKVIKKNNIRTLDLTGGAPEMNPDFRWFVEEVRKTNVEEIIVRSNLTIILSNPKYHDLPMFFKKNNVKVISSLPFYENTKTDKQRGDGVFEKSIKALQMLNKVGYGIKNSGLFLDLVYNPVGAFLPGNQHSLERDFKQKLRDNFSIEFNHLLTITNIPISRFLEFLIRTENYDDYMMMLANAFNPIAVNNLMCRNTISIDYQGQLYDCDFNQMLGLLLNKRDGQHIKDFDIEKLENREVIISQHCYGCTAGAGSSCQGAVT